MDYEVGEIELYTLEEANEVIGRLLILIKELGYATVYELYELVDIKGQCFLNERHGWRNLQGVHTVKGPNGGFLIKFPKTVEIEEN